MLCLSLLLIVCLTVLLQHGYVFLGIVFDVVFVFVFCFVFFFRVLLLPLLFFSYFSLCASVFIRFFWLPVCLLVFVTLAFGLVVVKCFHAKIDFLDLS